MAETFLAVQHGAAGFEQRVCMKFMLPVLRNDPGFRQMFMREATIAASLRHANIVGVIDVDEHEGYIVLELVDGVDLRTLLNSTPNRRLPPHVVSLIAIELCKALAYAHRRTRRGMPDGIVHRDISPSNVLVSHHGEVKLTDFGVAKAMGSTTEPSSTGIRGKLCYMSPEQTRGEPLDGRSDLFSLGVMLYELLAGVRPFDGPTDAQTLMRIENGRHRSLVEVAPEVPGALALIVERMLRPMPEHRYPSAEACVDALARLAPPVTTYRELGQLARAARQPVTLSSAEFGMAAPDSSARPIEALDRKHRAPTPPRAAEPDPARPRRASPSLPVTLPETADMPAPQLQVPRAPGAAARRRARSRAEHVSGAAWVALGISLSVGTLVLLAWISRLAGAVPTAAIENAVRTATAAAADGLEALRDAAKPDPEPITAPLRPAPSAAPTADDEPAPISPLVRPILPNTPNPDLANAQALGPAARQDGAQPRPAWPSSRGATPPANGAGSAYAVLRVGSVPAAPVWIDGHEAGDSPLTVELPAGSYTVGAGRRSPEVTRNVRLHPGETTRVVLQLPADSVVTDAALTPAARR